MLNFVILGQCTLILITNDAQDNLFVLNEGENYIMRDGGYWGLGGEGRKADKAGGEGSLCTDAMADRGTRICDGSHLPFTSFPTAMCT
jgi:hypothetical protein